MSATDELHAEDDREKGQLRAENAALREVIAEIVKWRDTRGPHFWSALEAAARLIGWDAKEEKR